MGRERHRIGVVRRFNEPVHVACRGPQYCVCQYSRGWKRGLSTANRPPSAEQNCFNGRPNEKTAADFVQQHRAGCFYYIVLLPPSRCRGPPVLADHKKYRTGECSMWQKNNRWESPKELQYRFTGYLQKAIRRGKAAYQKESRYLAFHEIPADIGDMRILDEMAPDMLETLPLLMQLDDANLVRALEHLEERELRILLARVLEEQAFEKIAQGLGLRYKGASAAYYRVVQKLRKELRGE